MKISINPLGMEFSSGRKMIVFIGLTTKTQSFPLSASKIMSSPDCVCKYHSNLQKKPFYHVFQNFT